MPSRSADLATTNPLPLRDAAELPRIQHRHIEVFRAIMLAGGVTGAAGLLFTSTPHAFALCFAIGCALTLVPLVPVLRLDTPRVLALLAP